jgi:predicted transcriptional regulator
MPAQSEKQLALEVLRSLPDDATLEDAIERLCFLAKVEEGLRQSEAGELIPQEEIKKQFAS